MKPYIWGATEVGLFMLFITHQLKMVDVFINNVSCKNFPTGVYIIIFRKPQRLILSLRTARRHLYDTYTTEKCLRVHI